MDTNPTIVRGKTVGILCGKVAVEVEPISTNGAIGWRSRTRDVVNPRTNYDETYAAFTVFRLGYGREAMNADMPTIEAIKEQLP
jgi:hypothetical protein